MTPPPPPGVPEDLLAEARRAFGNAFVPYSHFSVGAALRSESGTIYPGANVENVSFGLTRCAEQSAVQALVTAGERGFSEIVVYTDSDPPASPCGACRQILAEFSPEATVYMVNAAGEAVRASVRELLPAAFTELPARPRG